MKRYESKNHPGVFATVDKIDEKYKTAMLEFDDGKTQPVTVATLKRWWTLVDDNYDKEANVVKQDITDENTSEILVETVDDISDIQKPTEQTEDTVEETPVVEEETPEETVDTVEVEPTETEVEPTEEVILGKVEPIEVETEPTVDVEIPTEPVEKPKRTRKKTASGTSVATEVIATFREQIESAFENEFGLTKVSYAMDNVTLFRAGKKTVIRLYFGKRNLVFHVRPEIVPDGVEYDTYKYFLSAVFHKDYSEETMSFVKNLISVYKDEKANN